MLASGSRSVVRLASRGIVPPPPAPVRALCPACLQAQSSAGHRARSYGSIQRAPRRVKKVTSEFSSSPPVSQPQVGRRETETAPAFGTARAKVAAATDASLRSAFEALFDKPVQVSFASTSTSPSTGISLREIKSGLDPRQLVETVYPLIFRRKLRDSLDPYLEQISTILSRHTPSQSPSQSSSQSPSQSDEDLRRITTILGHCYFRSVTGFPSSIIVESYAKFLIRQAGSCSSSGEALGVLRKALLSVLERLESVGGYRVPPGIVAAWAVLWKDQPAPAQRLPAGLSLSHLDEKEIVAFLDDEMAGPLGHPTSAYAKIVSTLLAGNEPSPLPTNKEGLKEQIAGLRARGDMAGLAALWERERERARHLLSERDPISISAIGPDELAAFLHAFKRPVYNSNSPSRSALSTSQNQNIEIEAEKYAQQVLACCPKPLPRAIASTLLALRARPDDTSLEIGDQVRSLDEQADRPGRMRIRTDPKDTLENLHAAWKASGERDVKMYMMYMEGLGLFGDLEGLQRAWNEMVGDEECKQIYLAEDAEDPRASFPPTHALNHMISAAFLVPTTGPPVALNLFEQASRADSSIPINLITINTVLRHHARQADLPSMTALFSLAEARGFKPDIITYTTLLQGLLRAGQLDMAKRALGTMHTQGIAPNERTCSMLIADLAKSGDQKGLQHAEEMLKVMQRMKLRTNEVTWTGLIAGYIRGGWEEDGWEAVLRMERYGHRLNRVGYNVLLRQAGAGAGAGASGSGGDGEMGMGMGMRLFDRMVASGIKPNSDSYLLVLAPLVKRERWNEAERVLGVMGRMGFKAEKGALLRLVESVRRRRA